MAFAGGSGKTYSYQEDIFCGALWGILTFCLLLFVPCSSILESLLS